MKRIKHEYGWDEVITTHVNIQHIAKDFMTNTEWVAFNAKNPKIGKNRKRCKCCNREWTKMDDNVALAFTDKGNKSICETCMKYFESKGIRITTLK